MLPFPVRDVSKPIPIIQPKFHGYSRGIDGESHTIKRTEIPMNTAQIKCLRSFEAKALPIVQVNDIYKIAKASFAQTPISLKNHRNKNESKFKQINSSTYNL